MEVLHVLTSSRMVVAAVIMTIDNIKVEDYGLLLSDVQIYSGLGTRIDSYDPKIREDSPPTTSNMLTTLHYCI